MAKACAYLYRQCCFIDGFGDFGEIFLNSDAHHPASTILVSSERISWLVYFYYLPWIHIAYIHIELTQ